MALNRWDDQAAPEVLDRIGQRVYSSRLLGQDPSLVLHGGGNTSVKVERVNIFGEVEDLLLIKGSGWDLLSIEAAGFAPLRIAKLRQLGNLAELTDSEMAKQLADSRVDSSAPTPSVEALLHALLPQRFVDHTHADAIVTLTNSLRREDLVREVYGDSVIVVPYVMPGFDLANLCKRLLPGEFHPDTIGVILMNHGVITFGDTARESYDRMIELVTKAEAVLTSLPSTGPARPAFPKGPERRAVIADLRASISKASGRPMVLAVHSDDDALAFSQANDVAELSQRGPATPDHVIRTKPRPMIGRDVAAYADWYRRYFLAGQERSRGDVSMLDPAPRIVLDAELGLLCIGATPKDACIAEDIYRHTIKIVCGAEALGGYRSLTTEDLFDVEYWDLEQAKLRLSGPAKPQAGQIVLITGAASGIGRACAQRFIQEGAAVVGLDIDANVEDMFTSEAWLGVVCDVTSAVQLSDALDMAVDRFGGLDTLIVNAGIFPMASPLSDMDPAEWRRVMQINADSAVQLLHDAYPMLRSSPGGGRVIVIGSKNVAAPGPGASAYSASKAALTQLARVAALEWAEDAIRVNVIHPDAVFDTGLWAGGLLESRAAHYGMTVDDYRQRNLLHVEVTSHDVAELALSMAGAAFSKSTGAQVSIDGGNERVI